MRFILRKFLVFCFVVVNFLLIQVWAEAGRKRIDFSGKTEYPVSIITPEEVRNLQLNKEKFILLDVRSRKEYNKIHILNAISAPSNEITSRDCLKRISQNSGLSIKELMSERIILYCNSPSCNIATYAGKSLSFLGFKNIEIMEAGLKGWLQKGYPVVVPGKKEMLRKKPSLPQISVEGVKQKLDWNLKIVIIDIRDEESFKKGHIPGAINLSLDKFWRKKETLPRDKEIYIYGKDKDDERSSFACRVLIKRGYSLVREITGGFAQWQKKGYPVSK